jgi:hypothetical protein
MYDRQPGAFEEADGAFSLRHCALFVRDDLVRRAFRLQLAMSIRESHLTAI